MIQAMIKFPNVHHAGTCQSTSTYKHLIKLLLTSDLTRYGRHSGPSRDACPHPSASHPRTLLSHKLKLSSSSTRFIGVAIIIIIVEIDAAPRRCHSSHSLRAAAIAPRQCLRRYLPTETFIYARARVCVCVCVCAYVCTLAHVHACV